MPKAKYGTEFHVYIYLILLENYIVIKSFNNSVQPSSDRLSEDVTGMVESGVWDYLYGHERGTIRKVVRSKGYFF